MGVVRSLMQLEAKLPLMRSYNNCSYVIVHSRSTIVSFIPFVLNEDLDYSYHQASTGAAPVDFGACISWHKWRKMVQRCLFMSIDHLLDEPFCQSAYLL